MATTNMTLILPEVSATLGPQWATQLNTALTLVDAHDHSTGKGVKVTPSGLNINTDLSLQSNDLTLVRTVAFDSQAAALSSSDIRSVYSVLGDLYWNNGSGTAVQITSGASVQSSASTISRAFERLAVNANKVILAGDTYSYLDTDTGSSVTYTLPAANAVSAGRFYEFKDSTGGAAANPITINRAGADTVDGGTQYIISQNYGSIRLVSDGTSKWMLNERKFTASKVVVTDANGNKTTATTSTTEVQLLAGLTSVKNITNWTSWTPTGNFTTNTTYTGVYRRVGDTGEFQVNMAFAGAPNLVDQDIDLPPGLTIDVSKLPGSANTQIVGTCQARNTGSTFESGVVKYGTTTTVNLYYFSATPNPSSIDQGTRTFPFTIGNTDAITATFSVPIVEYA